MFVAGPLVPVLQRGWQLWRSNPYIFYRRVAHFLRSPARGMREIVDAPRRSKLIQQSYDAWLQCPGQAVAGESSDVDVDGPLLSVVMPVFNTPEDPLRASIESVMLQTYGAWELCIADDASTAPHVRRLLEDYASGDPRVRIVWREEQGHIAAASNTAIVHARGEFIVLLDHDDVLAPNALARVAEVIREDPTVDFVYSDEDKLDFDGSRVEPFFKPAWSPTLLTSGNYITHLAAMQRSLVIAVGGFRGETVGSQDHDLFLRVSERARTIAHIPQVLYSWRKSDTSTAVASSAKPYAIQAARHTLQDTIGRREMDATLEPSHMNGLFLIRHHPPSPTRVSLVLRGAARGWPAALDSPDIQVCDVTWIVGQHAEDYLERINEGAGDFLVFLDAEERPRSAKSISALLAYAQRDGAGVAAGMTVRRGTGDVLQAGLAIGQDGQPFYMYDGLPPFPLRNFYLNLKDLPREVSVGHAGCSAMRRAVWDALGGWSRDLPLPLTWWDLCLRALEAGYENVYTPLAQFEARAPLPPIPSVAAHDWPWRHFRDPFWNPNLTPAGSFGLPFRCDGDRRARCRPGSAAVLSSLLD